MNAFAQHLALAAEPAATVFPVLAVIAIALPVVAYVVLVIGALISIVGSGQELGMKVVWTIFVFIAPFIGSLLWFFVGRSHAERSTAH